MPSIALQDSSERIRTPQSASNHSVQFAPVLLLGVVMHAAMSFVSGIGTIGGPVVERIPGPSVRGKCRDSQSRSAYAEALTASFNALPAVNFGALLALIVIGSPVDGLRPVRSARLVTAKLPNPISCTTSPRAKARVRFSSAESSMRPASALLRLVSAAIAAMSSVLFKLRSF